MTTLQARTACIIGTLAVIGGGAAPAQGSLPRADYFFELTEAAPDTATGLKLGVFYRHPDDPDRKPPAITDISFELPEGLRLDTSAVPSCTATDNDLRVGGRGACPAESRVGAGSFTAMTGLPGVDPVALDVTVFNGVNQLIELVSFKGTDATAGSDRLTLEGRRLVAHPPATPGGPPDGRTVVREVKVTIPVRRAPDGRAYITTPPACPPAGIWVSTAVFGFADGGRANAAAQSPCIGSASSRPAATSLSTTPRSVPAGRRVRFALRVNSATAACRTGAVTVFAGRRRRTNASGMTFITATFPRAGLRRAVVVTRPGCRRAVAWVRVRRAS